VSMTNSTNRVEIITSVQHRRRWTAPEKVRMVEETFEPGMADPNVFRSGREFAAWVGFVPRQNSTGANLGWAASPNAAIAIYAFSFLAPVLELARE
jgi:hypothetical protein